MTTVYRDYDRAALDAQYFIRGRVPEFPDILARWIRQSDAAAARQRITRDIAYGGDRKQALDVYHAAASAGATAATPCLVFIHGGYWQALGKHECSFLAEAYTARGISVAMVDYRLCPQVSMTTIVEDCRSAIAALCARAGALGIDPTRMVVAGHSAGGHLTACLLATDWPRHGLAGFAFAGAVAVSGLYDLEPIRLCYLNDTLKMTAEEARRLSPIHQAALAKAPLILTVGSTESEEFHRQQAAFAAAWGPRLPITVVANAGHHYAAMEALGDPDHALAAATRRLLRG